MSAAVAAAAAAARISSSRTSHHESNPVVNHQRWTSFFPPSPQPALLVSDLSRYESQKRRDWKAFGQYLKKHRPSFRLYQCSGVHVLEFLEDRFGDNRVHAQSCPFLVNRPEPSSPCSCPLNEAWSSLDGLVGRLSVAFEENGGQPEMNPFSAGVVRLFLMEVKDAQAEARGNSL
ncbi:hypothetical protein GQ457_03G043110 [Hibiscus cannabinus]